MSGSFLPRAIHARGASARARAALTSTRARRAALAWCLASAFLAPTAAAATGGLGESAGYAFDEFVLSDRAVVKVNRASGNLFLHEIDVDRTNTDFEYDVTRSYNSLKGGFGATSVLVQQGWTHGLGVTDVVAKEHASGDVELSLPTGRELLFTKTAGGYATPAKTNLRLRLEGGSFLVFDVVTENEMRFARDSASPFPRISTLSALTDGAFDVFRVGDAQVLDSLGRSVDFAYVTGTRWATSAAGVQFGYDVATQQGNWPSQLRSARATSGLWESVYTYDAANRLASIATGGREVRVVYDGSGRVATVTEVAGGVPSRVTTYTYAPGATQVREPSGRVTTTTYGSDLTVTGSYAGASPPTLALSGSLYTAREQRLTPGTAYALAIDARDANGLALVEVLLDGNEEHDWELSCSTRCSPTYQVFRLGPEAWEPGWHTVAVRATDPGGEQRTMQFRIEVPETSLEEVPVTDDIEPGPDTETPITGEDCDAYFGAGSPYCAPDEIELSPFAATDRLIYGIADPDTRLIDDGTPDLMNGRLPSFLNDPYFQDLKVRRVRALLPWNLMQVGADGRLRFPNRVDAFARFYRLAIDRGMQITVSFQFGCDADLPADGTRSCYSQVNYNDVPKMDPWVRAMRRFKARFKKVRYISAWNEPNEGRQPTRPGISGSERAAKYTYRLERHVCSLAPSTNPCDVVAAELAPGGNSLRYLSKYRRKLKELHEDSLERTSMPEYWAYHPYGDIRRESKRRSSTSTYEVLKRIPAGAKLWFLEAGSRVDTGENDGVPRNNSRTQAREVRYLTTRLAPWFDRVTRVFYYQFCRSSAGAASVWDSSLLAPPTTAGQTWCTGPREAYGAYKDATLQNPNS